MERKLLFLMGGGDAIDIAGEPFAQAAGGRQARIVFLVQSRAAWEEFSEFYTEPFSAQGITQFDFIAPGPDGVLDLDSVAARLCAATGILIGGGPTQDYQRLYTAEPVLSLIRERYEQGTPVAGISAGTLILPEVCAIPPQDTGEESVRIAAGLGLVRDLVLGVHFSEWQGLPQLLAAMTQTHTRLGLGIDEPACAVLEDGHLARVLGQAVYSVTMVDFEAGTYQIHKM